MANNKQKDTKLRAVDTNPDPLTGAHGSHPVGTGVGAAGGGTLGAAIGTAVGGPVGGLAGAAIGAVAGGYAGKGTAEVIDPTVEAEYWRGAYTERPYYNPDYEFEAYEPAYRYGWESRSRMSDREWDEVEADLERDWAKSRGKSPLAWEGAREPVRDAWDRIPAKRSKKPDSSRKRG